MDTNSETIITQREFEILKMIAQGFSNVELAESLEISVHTVKAHIESIYRKFGVHNKVQAAIYAIYNNILDIKECTLESYRPNF